MSRGTLFQGYENGVADKNSLLVKYDRFDWTPNMEVQMTPIQGLICVWV
jgi:hypothetical protein